MAFELAAYWRGFRDLNTAFSPAEIGSVDATLTRRYDRGPRWCGAVYSL